LKEQNIGVEALDALRQFTWPYNQDSLGLLGRVCESFHFCGRKIPYLQEIVAKEFFPGYVLGW